MKSFITLMVIFSCGASQAKQLRLEKSEVRFNVTGKSELKIEKAFLSIRCLRKASFWDFFSNGGDEFKACGNFRINRDEQISSTKRIEITKNNAGVFELPQTNVSFSTGGKGHVCLALTVKFYGVESYLTLDLFENSYDGYSLHSYCTLTELPFSVNQATYNNKRVERLEDYKDELKRGVEVNLK